MEWFPCILLLVVFGAIFVFVVGRSRARLEAVEGAPPSLPPTIAKVATAELRKADAEFDAARVEAHVRMLFEKLQACAAEGSLDGAHVWLSDGLFERLETELKRSPDASLTRELALSRLATVSIAAFDRDEGAQSLTVSLGLVGSDGTNGAQTWRFHRRFRREEVARGLTEGRCPLCAAPLELVKQTTCKHCEAVVNSGEFDWVLTQATFGFEALHRQHPVADLSGLRAEDPGIVAAEVEDRAALIFARWVDASAARLTAGVEFADRPMSEFPAAPDSVRTATFELRALSRSRAGRQQAEVEVRWNERSGARGRQVLLLERARTPPPASRRRGLATSRCEACLGPIARTDLERCGFCGADFEAAWRLDAVVPFESWSKEQVGRLQTSSAVGHATGTTLSNLSQVDREAVLEAAVAVTFADGAIVDAERATLLALTARLGLPAQALEAAIERKPSPAFVKGRWTRHQGEAVILALVELVFVDGRAEPAERRVVRRLADSIDLGERFERALNERIRELMAKGLSGQ